ncbi:Bug family tripartite tricarboxylate transporter substrate binding protein [Ramlibacter rhizophilus]|uniref:Tripartite tricarboxylate transporter substrate binding protein n=1 Tax=Ramlibacter rhizophilus TaxID=1781167 RepID=A0A4Z0BQY1_9BURK|nr:tripartite tricarboxylate transporter substrate binding protein [Ramlibacter rhizophilus]TFZ01241.1 tripartite tricarboxylate transporter substrate binding protein [Ramlibacter rhizophilus]
MRQAQGFTRRATLAAIACLSAVALPALAQQGEGSGWPRQVVKLIVGYPAGTSPDLVARAISDPLSQRLGQPVIIENRPGAGGNIGVDLVAKARDNHTFGITTNGPLTTAPKLYPNLPYDVKKDIQPLSLTATSPLVLVTGTQVPADNLKDFIAMAKAKPGSVTYGSIGVGSGSHLTMELFANRAGIEALHVPYQGFPAVTSAILGGQIQSGFMAPSGALAQARAGKVKLLGITSPSRSTLAPEVPSIAEAGNMPGFSAELWTAAIAPASMPRPIAQRLSREITEILRLPEVRQRLFEQGWQPVGTAPEGLTNRIAADTKVWNDVITKANVKVN